MKEAQAQGCQNLLALHEAGHAIVNASLGIPIARATARHGRGLVKPDHGKAAILAKRARRQLSGTAPAWVGVALPLASMAGCAAGGAAVRLREAARPKASWQPFAAHYGSLSRDDRRGWYDAADRLYAIGLHGAAIGPLVLDWVDDALARHASSVATVAAALFRQGLMTGPEIDRLLHQVAADPVPMRRVVELAQHVASDPGLAWPVVDGCTPSHP
jgi:hypothetical protein